MRPWQWVPGNERETGQTAMGWMWDTSSEGKDRKYVMKGVVKRPGRSVLDKTRRGPVEAGKLWDVPGSLRDTRLAGEQFTGKGGQSLGDVGPDKKAVFPYRPSENSLQNSKQQG